MILRMLLPGRTFDSGIAAPDPPPNCGVARGGIPFPPWDAALSRLRPIPPQGGRLGRTSTGRRSRPSPAAGPPSVDACPSASSSSRGRARPCRRARIAARGRATARIGRRGAPLPRGPVPRARCTDRHPVLEPLARYLDDPDVTDLFVNGSSGLFVDRGRGASRRARVAGSRGGRARSRGRAHRPRWSPHR